MKLLFENWRKYLIEATLAAAPHPEADLEYAGKFDETVFPYDRQKGFQASTITLPQAIAKSSKSYVIVNFMGLHCPPCIKEFKLFRQFIAANKNFDFYMVDVLGGYDEEEESLKMNNEYLLEFLKEHGKKLPSNTKIYGAHPMAGGAPDTFLVRRKDGAIYFWVGGAFHSYQQLDATIRYSIAVKEKKPVPSAPTAPKKVPNILDTINTSEWQRGAMEKTKGFYDSLQAEEQVDLRADLYLWSGDDTVSTFAATRRDMKRRYPTLEIVPGPKSWGRLTNPQKLKFMQVYSGILKNILSALPMGQKK